MSRINDIGENENQFSKISKLIQGEEILPQYVFNPPSKQILTDQLENRYLGSMHQLLDKVKNDSEKGPGVLTDYERNALETICQEYGKLRKANDILIEEIKKFEKEMILMEDENQILNEYVQKANQIG